MVRELGGRLLMMRTLSLSIWLILSTSLNFAADNEIQGESPVMESNRPRIVFATFAQNATQLRHALVLCESLRKFGGRFSDAPMIIYVPPELMAGDSSLVARLEKMGVTRRQISAPPEALRYFYARKVYAAAQCEEELDDDNQILVWLDEDTIILQEPAEFDISGKLIKVGWRPVMHRNIGSLYAEPPDQFWSRVYHLLKIPDSSIFPMKTAASDEIIRPYINAGILVVRTDAGLLRQWKKAFETLYQDSMIKQQARLDPKTNIFLHQAALAGAFLTTLSKDEMYQLPDSYNYPLFFKQMFGAPREFNDIEKVVTLRYDVFFENPTPDWWLNLTGSPATVAWMKARLGSPLQSE